MKKLFYPETIVIIGLSAKIDNMPKVILENIIRWRYSGRIFGVHPKAKDTHVDGIKMYRSVTELPVVPDLAICLIPARFVPETLEECGKFGIQRLAVTSGGFNELGEEGGRLAEQAVEIAEKYNLRFIGPNGLGVANTENGLCTPFVPLNKPKKGGLSLITQSGGLGLVLWNLLAEENVGLAKFASIGNKLNIDELEILKYLGDDPKTKVICLYLESINNGRMFCELAARIRKPIIVLKSNTTSAGKKSAMSHTAAVSNNDDIVDTAFERAGIIRIESFSEFISVAKAFELPPMRGDRLMMMTPYGGFAVMMADMSEKLGFRLADPGEEFYKKMDSSANAGIINFSNPLDLGDIYDPTIYRDVIFSVLHNEKVDGAVYISSWPKIPKGGELFTPILNLDLSTDAVGAMRSSDKPIAICLFGESDSMRSIKSSFPMPVFNSLGEMMKGLRRQQDYWTKKALGIKPCIEPVDVDKFAARDWIRQNTGSVGEQAFELLSKYKINHPVSKAATGQESAISTAAEVGFPVVMKVMSPDALHKSEVGGVLVNIHSAEEAGDAFIKIKENLKRHNPNAAFEGVRIMRQVGGGTDMFIGGVRDPSFGPVVFFGYGGIYIEVFKDVQSALCPANYPEIKMKVQRLKSYSILKGARGKKPGDIEGFIDSILRVSRLMADVPQIEELDINPIRLPEDGSKPIALDIRLRSSS